MGSHDLTLVLARRDIERLIGMPAVLRVVERAFVAQARGATSMPPKVYLNLPGGADFRAMPAYLAHPAACGMKWVNVHPRNGSKGLPTVMAVVVINDPATGFPLAVLEGSLITRLRTAAAAGVATKHLARRDARVLALIGCGAQALDQVRAVAAVRRLREVRVWGYRRGEAARFCARARRQLAIPLRPVGSVREAVTHADVITTITISRRPLVRRAWVAPGTHINAIGADAPGKQELDARLLRDGVVVIDECRQAIHGGEINVPIRKGQFSPRQIRGTLGEVILGRARGRRGARDITIFDSTGLAIHDVALGHELDRLARRRRVGRSIDLLV